MGLPGLKNTSCLSQGCLQPVQCVVQDLTSNIASAQRVLDPPDDESFDFSVTFRGDFEVGQSCCTSNQSVNGSLEGCPPSTGTRHQTWLVKTTVYQTDMMIYCCRDRTGSTQQKQFDSGQSTLHNLSGTICALIISYFRFDNNLPLLHASHTLTHRQLCINKMCCF